MMRCLALAVGKRSVVQIKERLSYYCALAAQGARKRASTTEFNARDGAKEISTGLKQTVHQTKEKEGKEEKKQKKRRRRFRGEGKEWEGEKEARWRKGFFRKRSWSER